MREEIFEKCYSFTQADEVRRAGLYPYFRPISTEQDTEVVIEGRRLLMLGSNSYLGLTNHPRVKEAAVRAINKYGTGCAGSRFLNGTLDLHLELEEEISTFVGKESALLFSTGFQTNLGIIATLVGKGDYVVADKSDHASIVEGCRLALGKTKRYRHNSLDDLRHVIGKIPHDAGVMIVVDGMYSMEGDLAPLPQICSIAREFGARVMVDDAHGLGVMGMDGAGTPQHFGVTHEVDIIMGTFSKSLASLGGFAASSREVIEYLKHAARTIIFSASISPPNAAAALEALRILKEEPERREQLWRVTYHLQDGLRSLGFYIGNTQTPVIPVYIGDPLKTFQMCMALHEEGVFVNPVVPPGVAPGQSLLRVSCMATHTIEQMDFALDKFRLVGEKMGVI